MSIDTSAKLTDLDKVKEKMNALTPLTLFQNMADDIGDMARKDDLEKIKRELDFIKKDFDSMCTKEEMIKRLNVFNSDVNTKLMDRPTISYFKKVLSAYDVKIEQFNIIL